MSDKSFDNLLQKLPQVLNDGLKPLEFTEEMRKEVGARLKQVQFEKTQPRKLHFSIAFTAALMMFVICVAVRFWTPVIHPPSAVSAFETQETLDIDLDGKGQPEMVNTWKVRKADDDVTLMALIWARDHSGQLNVVSTLPFEGKEFLPIEVITPSVQRGNLVVIAATDGESTIYYRVLGYDGQQVLPYLERTTKFYNMRYQMLREIQRLLPVSIK